MQSTQEMIEFIKTLKAGSTYEAVVHSGGFRSRRAVVTVEVKRFTTTQFVCSVNGWERRYRIKDGKQIGGRYFEYLPRPATAEEIAQVSAEDTHCKLARRMLNEVSWPSLSSDKLQRIAAIVDEKEKADEPA